MPRRKTLLSLLALLSLLTVTGCGWELDNPRDPQRCERACAADEACFEGQCLLGAWVLIQAGSFQMGSPTDEPCREPDTGTTRETRHPVTLTHRFAISQTEVTEAQFRAVLGHESWTTTCGAACPARELTWHEAAAYCNGLSTAGNLSPCYSCSGSGSGVTCAYAADRRGVKIYGCPGYRLPTEAEWEYAYRAGSTTALYNGPVTSCSGTDAGAEAIAWYHELHDQPRPVKQKQPNTWGLYDMAGGVAEWCHDRFKPDLGAAAVTDPVFEADATFGVYRGGSFGGGATFIRAAYRQGGDAPTATQPYVGFRCVRTR